MTPEQRVFGENRRSQRSGWVEDNVFAALGVRKERNREPLEDVNGRLLFYFLAGAPNPTGLLRMKVAFKRRRPGQRARDRETLGFETLEEVLCKGGKTLVIHSFRPQRPRANTSVGARCGVVECEMR